MSLHTLAQHLQSAGRGDDKVLVHMTPAEVGSLQTLANAHGGTLTTNPDTGLPEAGFLSSLLPMAAGLALGPAGMGLTALQAGLVAGAAGTALTGSLQKGLMYGLGAYGGAGLGAGLQSLGTAAQPAATPVANLGNTSVEAMKSAAYTNPATGKTYGIFGGPTAVPSVPPVTTATATPTTAFTSQNIPSALRGGAGFGMEQAAAPLYPPGHPLYTPVQGQMNLAGQAFVPGTSGLPRTEFLFDPTATQGPQFLQKSGFHPTPTVATVPQKPVFDITKSLQDAAARTPVKLESTLAVPEAQMVAPEGKFATLGRGLKEATGSMEGLKKLYTAAEAEAPYSGLASLGSTAMGYMEDKKLKPKEQTALIRPYTFTREVTPGAFDVGAPIYSATPGSSAERQFFTDQYIAGTPYKAPGEEYAAAGGIMRLAVGGPIETMTALNSVGANTQYPMADINTPMYANPLIQRPEAINVISPSADAGVGAYTGEPRFAVGGIANLGSYSDGGRLLKGPGDGVSDSIPAVIGDRQPARLADGEFVIPARIVSEIGNGSTDAGARKLYAMMDRIQKARGKTVGKDQVAKNTKADKYLPA